LIQRYSQSLRSENDKVMRKEVEFTEQEAKGIGFSKPTAPPVIRNHFSLIMLLKIMACLWIKTGKTSRLKHKNLMQQAAFFEPLRS